MNDRRLNITEDGKIEGQVIGKPIRRINLYGGPCSGKSTLASYIFAKLKMQNRSVELISEYIKFWTYIPRTPKGYDSFYCQSKHVHKEDTVLRSGTDLIVSDSPILLAYFYAYYYDSPAQDAMLSIHREFEKEYPSINIVLEREDKFYEQHGRYENLEQSKEIDNVLKNVVIKHTNDFEFFSCLDQDKIFDYIISRINNVKS